MMNIKSNPRLLVVTPEITYLPDGMGNMANYLSAKAGGLADVSSALISALFDQGADVHIAMPDYRAMFSTTMSPLLRKELRRIRNRMPLDRIHLAEDRSFFYIHSVYSSHGSENVKVALAFQREVINHIIPIVQPDLIHCNDWMTGLIPAFARELQIPCLFTFHNIHTVKTYLSEIEDRGIDSEEFWHHLYFENQPLSYEHARDLNPIDFLTSGIFAAHFVNTVSLSFLKEVVDGHHNFIAPFLKNEIRNKYNAGCATGIINAPDPSFNPKRDKVLPIQYGPEDHHKNKSLCKRYLQKKVGLMQDINAPIFFWPSRLDPIQKGCQLLADILHDVVSTYWENHLQILFVANGSFQKYFKEIVGFHHFHNRVAVWDFNENLERLAYAGSDFILMPSKFEPCGLPQMIGTLYGALPVAFNTGGIHDTIRHLDVAQQKGNGFLFDHHDSQGLFWAISEAMRFYSLPTQQKQIQIQRIMTEAQNEFNHTVTAKNYMELYENMLQRPLIGD